MNRLRHPQAKHTVGRWMSYFILTILALRLHLIRYFLDCEIDSPIMPGGEAFLEYDAMTCRGHLMSGHE
ncbi:hypothetical protein ATN79_47120 [Paraburkholderia caribensis]|nr:hypothetical protein ATN79_47120 [Paraburkholderia caribensis]